MLKTFRKKGFAKRVIWIVAIVIIISFGFLGTAYLLTASGPARYAGKIFGKKISLEDYTDAFAQTEMFAKLRLGDRFFDVQETLDLNSETWDRLILMHEAKRQRINISDEKVAEEIREYPIFQRDGAFDRLLYNAILQSSFLRVQPREFEESIRDNLKIAELIEQESDNVKITEAEIEQTFRQLNDKVQVSYVLFPPQRYIDQVPVTESELQRYYQNNTQQFLTEPAVEVQYVSFPFPKDTEPAEDEAVTEAAENDGAAASISSAKDTVRSKAIEFYQSIRDSETTMAAAAEQFQVPVQTSTYFNQRQQTMTYPWPFRIMHKLFSLDTGEIMEPFELSTGMVVAKIIEKKPPYVPEFSEVRDQVRKHFAMNQARDIAKSQAQQALANIEADFAQTKAPDFAKIVQNLGFDAEQTPLFNRGLYLPTVGLSGDFQDAAFALEPSDPISDVVETAAGFAILHLDDKAPADMADYEKEKDKIAQALVNERSEDIYNRFLTRLRLQANLEDNISKLRDAASPAIN